MRLRPAAVPSVDPIPAPADGGLLDREQSALDAERAIASEAEALARSIDQLAAQAQAFIDRAAQLQQAGAPEAEWLLARFHSHRLECPDLSGPSSQALAARTQALAARARSVEMARVLLGSSASAVEEHQAGLARDAAELERVEAAAAEARAEETRRAEAARKEAEEREVRARREAQAAAERARSAAAEASRPPPSAARPRAAVPVLTAQKPTATSAPAQAAATSQPSVPARPRAAGQTLGRMSTAAAGPGRAGARIPMQTQVDLTSDSNVFTGFSTNLSEGGLFVATHNLLPVGTPVDLTFTLPGNTRVSVRGEVRWTREIDDRVPDVFPGVGVRFVELTPQASEALHRFVTEREPLFYPD